MSVDAVGNFIIGCVFHINRRFYFYSIRRFNSGFGSKRNGFISIKSISHPKSTNIQEIGFFFIDELIVVITRVNFGRWRNIRKGYSFPFSFVKINEVIREIFIDIYTVIANVSESGFVTFIATSIIYIVKIITMWTLSVEKCIVIFVPFSIFFTDNLYRVFL